MGILYRLKCPSCGYRFDAMFGYGRLEEPQKKLRERLESENRKDEAALVWSVLKNRGDVSMEADCKPFLCYGCRKMFNYFRAIIYGTEGRFIEEKGVCPTCGQDVSSGFGIEHDDLEGDGENGCGKCRSQCPCCHEYLHVTGHAIWD